MPEQSTPKIGLSPIEQEVLKLIKDALVNKPQTQADATALIHSLSLKLASCIVEELPFVEAKATLVELWFAKKVKANCLSFI